MTRTSSSLSIRLTIMSQPRVPEPATTKGWASLVSKTLRRSSIASPKTGTNNGSTWEVAGVLMAFKTSSWNSMGPRMVHTVSVGAYYKCLQTCRKSSCFLLSISTAVFTWDHAKLVRLRHGDVGIGEVRKGWKENKVAGDLKFIPISKMTKSHRPGILAESEKCGQSSSIHNQTPVWSPGKDWCWGWRSRWNRENQI